MQLIQVLYRNARGGPVDDITLDELIRSRRITHFYRPSEERWVDIFVDPVRGRDHAPDGAHLKRRYADREEDNKQGAKSSTVFRGVFTRLIKPRRALSAAAWLKRRFSALDDLAAARAFASCIRLDPQRQEAYLHRGLVYEALGNFQQALEDYSAAIALDPSGQAHDLVLGRPGVTAGAIAGLRRAADLQRASERRLSASPAELRESLEGFTEPHRDEGKVGDMGAEGSPKVAGSVQRLVERYAKEITHLEAQLREVRHRRDILAEAVRLLDEEVSTPQGTLLQ